MPKLFLFYVNGGLEFFLFGYACLFPASFGGECAFSFLVLGCRCIVKNLYRVTLRIYER